MATTSKVQIDPVFYQAVTSLAKWATAQGEALKRGQQTRWFRVANWQHKPTDWEGLQQALLPVQVEAGLMAAMTDAQAPSPVGDAILGETQIAYLQSLMRALRLRYTANRAQRVAHQAGRLTGHGSRFGVFSDNVLGYLLRVAEEAGQAE